MECYFNTITNHVAKKSQLTILFFSRPILSPALLALLFQGYHKAVVTPTARHSGFYLEGLFSDCNALQAHPLKRQLKIILKS